jgi:hypothetical protein
LAVEPTVRTKLAISLSSFNFCIETLMEVGRVAFEELVENAVIITSLSFLKNSLGFVFTAYLRIIPHMLQENVLQVR